MTEPYYDENDTDDGNDDGQQERYVQLTRQQIRALERDAKSARKAADEAAALRRELAFARAGSDFTERQQKALLATIEGDLTPEAIREAAVELNFIAAPAVDKAAQAEAHELTRMAQPAPGSADSPDEDPIARLHRAAEEGGPEAILAELQRAGHSVVPGA